MLSSAASKANISDVDRLAPSLKEQAKIASETEGATTLYSVFDHHLTTDKKWIRQQYTSIKINDLDAARDYGRIAIHYNEHYKDFKLEFANVYTKTGQIKPLNTEAVSIRNVNGNQDFYDDRKEIVFSLPQIEPGSIIEFQVTSRTKNRAIDQVVSDFVVPHWIQPRVAMDGYRADKVKYFSYKRSLPANVTFKTQTYAGITNKAKILKQQDRIVTHYQQRDIPEVAIEAYMPDIDRVRPAIAGSSSSDWSLVSQWFWHKVAPQLVVTEEIQKVIDSMKLAATASDTEKVQAVYNYMQNNIRYVYAHISNGGYDPHPPSEVLAARFGDCKDQTVLAITLLKALNVEAYPLLIQTPRAGKSDMALVSLIFDHVIVAIPPNDTRPAMYLDTTPDRALFPGVSSYLAGQPALRAGPESEPAFKFPQVGPRNVTDVDLRYRFNKNRQIVIDVDIAYQGAAEENIRQWWKNDHNRDTNIKSLFESILENKGQYELSYEVKHAENLYQAIQIQGRFLLKERIPDNKAFNYGVSAIQLARITGLSSALQAPDSRKNRYVDASAITANLHATFPRPEDYLQALIISADSITTPFFSVNQKAQTKPQGLEVSIKLERKPLDLTVEQYSDYHQSIIKLGTQGSWLITNQVGKAKTQALNLAATEQKFGGDSFEFQLKSAKQHIDSGAFDTAMPFAKRAVELDSSNAEAWFILGTTQGYLGDIDASLDSFNKAKKLGYTP